MTDPDGGGIGDPVTGRAGRVLAIAHRGDPIAFRENTVAGVRSAVQAGADVVEIDVKTTADAVSVVLHDDSLQRLWGLDRDIRTLTAADLAAVGRGDERIPTLVEVLRLFEGASCAVLVDMDSGAWATAARKAVASVLADGRLRPTQVMWCGHLEGMREVRGADPDARIYLSWGEEALTGAPDDDLVAQLRPEAFNPHWEVLQGGGRAWAAERGLPLCCWTVDDRALMTRLLQDGVDAVISNDIRALVAVLRGADTVVEA